MVPVLLLLMARLAVAATPLVLPAGEPRAPWEEAARLGDLVIGAPPAHGACVWVVSNGGAWEVRVRAEDGRTREAPVDGPRSAADREDIVWLGVSLLHSLANPAVSPVPTARAPVPPPARVMPRPRPRLAPPVPTPKPPLPTPDPSPAPTPDPSPAPTPEPPLSPADPPVVEAAPPTPEPPPVEPSFVPDPSAFAPVDPTVAERPETLDLDIAPAPSPPLHVSVSADGTLGYRAGTSSAPSLAISGALEHGDWHVGLRCRFGAFDATRYADAPLTVRSVDLSAVVGWSSPLFLTPDAGLGISRRKATWAGEPVSEGLVPTLVISLRAPLPVAFLTVAPFAEVDVDLRRTGFVQDGIVVAFPGRTAFCGGLALSHGWTLRHVQEE